MKLEVTLAFNQAVRDRIKNEPTCLYIINHERKPKAIENLCEQIKIAEMSLGMKFETGRYKMIIDACAAMFCNTVLKHAEEQALSHLEYSRRVQEAGRMDQLEEEFDEMQKEALDTKITSYPGKPAI